MVASVLIALLTLGSLTSLHAQPPVNLEFGRTQQTRIDFDVDDLLRIWIVYVGQGDGMLIQFPPKYNYDPDPDDGDDQRTERVDVVVDGGPKGGRLMQFVESLYGDTSPTLEDVVITHHDGDHIHGITTILEQTDMSVRRIYHNGLASYTVDKPDFTPNTTTSEAIIKKEGGEFIKGMAFFTEGLLHDDYLVPAKPQLMTHLDNEHLEGLYDEFARAVFDDDVESVPRAHVGNAFVEVEELKCDGPKVKFELIWPLETLRRYGDWGKTINGNSVTFRLTYGDFEMLFTGDLNKKSQPVLLEHYQDQLEVLNCDVLKIPHHGSHDAHEPFFKRDGFTPVLGVASMGSRGFTKSWKHPSTDVIQWLGGFDRVYHTFIKESAFSWNNFDQGVKSDMTELSHILIETDGKWFRLVEIDAVEGDIHQPPTVVETSLGDGTQWIRAKPGQ